MKKSMLLLIASLFIAQVAFADTWFDSNDAQIGQFSEVKCSTGVTCSQVSGKVAVSFATSFPSTLGSNAVDAANSVWAVSNGLRFEGATADAHETTITPVDPTADNPLSIPNTAGAAGTVRLSGATVVITAGATPTLTVPLGVDFIATLTIVTDNQDTTITFSSGGSLGQIARVLLITDTGGAGDEVATFQTTLTNTTGTLTLANLTAGRYVVSFVSDGTVFNEVSRTAALS